MEVIHSQSGSGELARVLRVCSVAHLGATLGSEGASAPAASPQKEARRFESEVKNCFVSCLGRSFLSSWSVLGHLVWHLREASGALWGQLGALGLISCLSGP